MMRNTLICRLLLKNANTTPSRQLRLASSVSRLASRVISNIIPQTKIVLLSFVLPISCFLEHAWMSKKTTLKKGERSHARARMSGRKSLGEI
jgi:hypothetical protein